MMNEMRWKQRLQNLNKAFLRLDEACKRTHYSDLEMAGLVQTYEFTFELCWKTLKDKMTYDGYTVNSPRETLKQAFASSVITDIDSWLQALESRNLLIHVYDDAVAMEAVSLIRERFLPMLNQCVTTLNMMAGQNA